MKILQCFYLALFLVFSPMVSAEKVQFLSSIPEIPLPQGAYENYEEATVFDALDGRFVEVELFLEKNNTTETISYYNELLPSLGWSKINRQEFYKGKESLKLSSSDSYPQDRIKILLQPR